MKKVVFIPVMIALAVAICLLVNTFFINVLDADLDRKSLWLSRPINQGQVLHIGSASQVAVGEYIGVDKLSGMLKYYIEPDGLRVKADVTDVYFSTDALARCPWEASCVELTICASGNKGRVAQYIVIPDGADSRARIFGVWTEGVTAEWKRTGKGYLISAKIPWRTMTSYNHGWDVLPVQAAINTKAPNGRVQMTMTAHGDVWDEETFMGLRRADPYQSGLPCELYESLRPRLVNQGQPLYVVSRGQVCVGEYPGEDKLSGVFRYYLEPDGLRIKADITDAYFSTRAPLDSPWQASCVELLVCASGVHDQINQFVVIPEGENGKARIYPADEEQVSAEWKRTSKGYWFSAKIPWKSIIGYSSGWKVLPIQAAINSKTPKGRLQITLTGGGEPWDELTYAGLKAK